MKEQTSIDRARVPARDGTAAAKSIPRLVPEASIGSEQHGPAGGSANTGEAKSPRPARPRLASNRRNKGLVEAYKDAQRANVWLEQQRAAWEAHAKDCEVTIGRFDEILKKV